MRSYTRVSRFSPFPLQISSFPSVSFFFRPHLPSSLILRALFAATFCYFIIPRSLAPLIPRHINYTLNMSPIAINNSLKDSLNAEAESFKPVGNGNQAIDPYHSATSATAIAAESAYAAHNYHPLPVVFSRAQGVDVWDPEGMSCAHAAIVIYGSLTMCRQTLP